MSAGRRIPDPVNILIRPLSLQSFTPHPTDRGPTLLPPTSLERDSRWKVYESRLSLPGRRGDRGITPDRHQCRDGVDTMGTYGGP